MGGHAAVWMETFCEFNERVKGLASEINKTKTPVVLTPELKKEIDAMEEEAMDIASESLGEILGGFLSKIRKRVVVDLGLEVDEMDDNIDEDVDFSSINEKQEAVLREMVIKIRKKDEEAETISAEEVAEISPSLSDDDVCPKGVQDVDGKGERGEGEGATGLVKPSGGDSPSASVAGERPDKTSFAGDVREGSTAFVPKKLVTTVPQELARAVFDTVFKDDPRRMLLDDVCIFSRHGCLDLITNVLVHDERARDRVIIFNNKVVKFYKEAAGELNDHIRMQRRSKKCLGDIFQDEGLYMVQVFVDYANTQGVSLIADLTQIAPKGRKKQMDLVDSLNS